MSEGRNENIINETLERIFSVEFLRGFFRFRKDEKTVDEHDPRLQPSDTYLIPSQPLRGGKTPEVSHRTNTHVLITFGLQVKLWVVFFCILPF